MKFKHLFLFFIMSILCVTQMIAAEIPAKFVGEGNWVTLKTENGYYFYAIGNGNDVKLGQTTVAPKGDGVVSADDPHHYSRYCWLIEGNATEGYTFRCLHYDDKGRKYIANPSNLVTNTAEVVLADEGSKYLYTDNHQLQLKDNTNLYLAFYSSRYTTIRLHNSANYIGSKMVIGGISDWSVAAVVYGTETIGEDGLPQGTYLPNGGVTYGGQDYKHGSSLYIQDTSSEFSIIPIQGYTKSTIKIDEENHYIVAYYVGNESGISYKNANTTKESETIVIGENNTIWSLEAQNYITNTSGKYTNVPAGKAWQMEMVVQNTNKEGNDPSFNKWGSCILSSNGDPINTYYWGDFQVYQHAPTHSSPNTLNFKSSKADGMDHIIAQGHSVEHQNYKVIVRYNGGNIYLIRTIILNEDLTETNTIYNNVWVSARQQVDISQMSCALPTGINLKSLKISIAEESNLLEDVDYAIQNIGNNDYLTGARDQRAEWHSQYAGDAAKFQIEWTGRNDLTYAEQDGGLHNSFYIKVNSTQYLGDNYINVDNKENAVPFIYTTSKHVAPITATNTLSTEWKIDTYNTWDFDFFANFYVEVAGNNDGGLKYKKNHVDQIAKNGNFVELPSLVSTDQLANSSQKGFSATISKQDIRLKVQYSPLENTFYNFTDKSLSATTLYYWYKSVNKLVTYSTKNSQSGIDTDWGEKGDCTKFTITKATSIPMGALNPGGDGKYYNTVYCPNALTLPTGVKAYRLDNILGGNFRLKHIELTDNVLPAETPVVLISENPVATSNWNINTVSPAGISETNLFKGVFEQTTNPGSGKGNQSLIFVLGGTKGVGFYHYSAENIPAFKAYYESPAQQAKQFTFIFDDTTAIDEITNDVDKAANTIIYDLMGRRVSAIQKGRMYIINGKKLLVK